MFKEDNGFHHITIATKPHQILDLMKTRMKRQGEKIWLKKKTGISVGKPMRILD